MTTPINIYPPSITRGPDHRSARLSPVRIGSSIERCSRSEMSRFVTLSKVDQDLGEPYELKDWAIEVK